MNKMKLYVQVERSTREESSGEWPDVDGFIISSRAVMHACGHVPKFLDNPSESELADARAYGLDGCILDDPLDTKGVPANGGPGMRTVARARVYQPTARFNFNPHDHYEGFKTYMPDLSTYRTYAVNGGRESLTDWLKRMTSLDIDAVWLHNTTAEASGLGFDLEMLERAARFYEGDIWVSGGATCSEHVIRLSEEFRVHAAVLPLATAELFDLGQLRGMMKPRLRVEVDNGPGENNAVCGGAGRLT